MNFTGEACSSESVITRKRVRPIKRRRRQSNPVSGKSNWMSRQRVTQAGLLPASLYGPSTETTPGTEVSTLQLVGESFIVLE